MLHYLHEEWITGKSYLDMSHCKDGEEVEIGLKIKEQQAV